MRLLDSIPYGSSVVTLGPDALVETRSAFDTVAETYHDENQRNPVIREMRRRTIEAVTSRLAPGSRLLDLGCGPGPDAEHLGRLGYEVLAIDWSPEMAEEASRRIRASGLERRVEVRNLGIHELDRLEAGGFDGAYSNLGPLNCVPDLGAAARWISERLKPGGLFAASIIGRVCPWEIALYGIRRDWKRLRVRFSRDFVPVPFYGRRIWTRYYDPAEVEGTFAAAGLERVALRSLGLLVPPPYLEGFAARHPGVVKVLEKLEDQVASCPGLRRWGDHFLIVMGKP
jgi:SAM-dependent methyltransferase